MVLRNNLNYIFIIITIIISYCQCLPTISGKNESPILDEKNIFGRATNLIALNVLKANVELNKNFVMSPMGFASILTILSEGARGDTRKEILNYLKYPEDILVVRDAYKKAFENLQYTNDPRKLPQFKTWFYVYRNNTIEPDFKTILEKNYYVSVKDVDREYYNWNDPDTVDPIIEDNYNDEDLLIDNNKDDNIMDKVQPSIANTNNNSKDIPEFEALKIHHVSDPDDQTRLIANDDQLDSSKFDEIVEDRQYVETHLIKDKIVKDELNTISTGDSDNNRDINNNNNNNDNENILIIENPKVKTITGANNEPEKLTLPIKLIEDLEIMQAVESIHEGRNLHFGLDGDIASGISGNSIVGKRTVKELDDKSPYESKMLLFNGLYYRGAWATPFQRLRLSPETVFHTSINNTYEIKMMRSCGYFKTADLPDYDSQAILLDYENERYGLLILMPNEINGLKNVLLKIHENTIPNEILPKMTEQFVDLSMPKFNVETTSGAEKMLVRSGLASIFTTKADFSGITEEQHLHIEELQQHVSLHIDEGASTENFLTATGTFRSNSQPDVTVNINRSFLYFVYDLIDNLIIVGGKMVKPVPLSDEIEPY